MNSKGSQKNVKLARSKLADIRWGLRGSLVVTGIYCGWVIAVRAIVGDRPFTANSVSLGTVVLTYAVVGMMAGALVGVMRPFLKWRAGAYAAGVSTGLILSMGIIASVKGYPSTWDRGSWIAVLVVSIAAGFVVGDAIWKRQNA